MFSLLFFAGYSAFKHFSGTDPLKLDPKSIFENLIQARTPEQVLGVLTSIKLREKLPNISTDNEISVGNTKEVAAGNALFKFLLISDSHNDSINLQRSLAQAKQSYPDLQFIIGLGDYTDVGTLKELADAKSEFDLSGLRYFLIPGDHDLWDARDKGQDPLNNFRQTFGPSYQYFTYQDFHFVLVNNADNYLGVGTEQINWVTEQLDKTNQDGTRGIFVFIHEPLFHPSSDHIMGRVEKNLKHEAKNLINLFAEAKVNKVFSGDIHFFGEYIEPETGLNMASIGAVTSARNPQASRYAIVTVMDDGSTLVEDIEVR